MKIFSREPDTWKELQDFVSQIFKECAFETEVSKVVNLVRGKKEIDVYTEDNSSDYKLVILVECKYWNAPINQEVIHAFRTVINDLGANIGYIVSKNGFQSGCYEAVEKTNIKLVSLKELEEIYHLKWRGEMVKKYSPYSKPLLPYWLCSSSPGKTANGKVVDFNTQLLLSRAYSPVCDLALRDYFEEGIVKYPFSIPVINDNLEPTGVLEIKNDREYFDFCEKNKELALRHHKILFEEI
ncbi:MAG: restriction endonuclease [Bacteroidota bacterium]